MLKKNKYRYLLIIGICFLVMPILVKSQTGTGSIIGADELLKEYLFPISVSSGKALGEPVTATAEPYTFDSGGGVMATVLAYNFDIKDAGNYVLAVTAANAVDDNFSLLTDEEVRFIFDTYADQETINNLYLDVPASSGSKEELFRSLVFEVYIDFSDEANFKGFAVVPNNGQTASTGSVVLENLPRGSHKIILSPISNFTYYSDIGVCQGGNIDGNNCRTGDAGMCTGGGTCTAREIPAEFEHLSSNLTSAANASQVSLDKAIVSDDVVGVRIYSNKKNKDPLRWYKDNVINASGSIQSMEVDGYRGVMDGRTIYVDAANLFETPKVCQGTTQACNLDSECSGVRCLAPRVFYTNIYVIAYNQSAAVQTQNIFNQMLKNWIFNKNVVEDDPFTAEAFKDKLRRDTIRKSDAFDLQEYLDQYRSVHGSCPMLEAGTFVKDHTLSTWPSWQATLGNKLETGLPVDPLNIMGTGIESKYYGPYDCTQSVNVDSGNCSNRCSDTNLGCPATSQCVNNSFCGVCPPGEQYKDPQVCWDDKNLVFPFTEHTGCSGDSSYLNTFFKLGGDNCQSNGAYVYQYSDKNCSFLIRYEYAEDNVCLPGQCYYGGTCYDAGACLAGCTTAGDGTMTCENENYKNVYCYLGTWNSSCGDGFIQSACGEACDRSKATSEGQSWCDITYGQQGWYNESGIGLSCNDQCNWEGIETLGYTPQRYTPQLDDIDCGGYCGDQVRQVLYGEQCDQGLSPAPIPKPVNSGVGGITGDLQYMCSGVSGLAGGGQPFVKNGASCTGFSGTIYDPITAANTCTKPPLPVENYGVPEWVNIANDKLYAKGGFKASYTFNVLQSGIYRFKLKSANLGDSLAGLTTAQIDYLISLKQAANPAADLLPIQADGSITFPEYGTATEDDLKSLVYSVYLDGDDAAKRKGFVFVEGESEERPQEAVLDLGLLEAGEHTINLHFLSDLYFDYSALTLPGGDADYFSSVDFDNNKNIDVNPLIISASLEPSGSGVGNCRTYGGWCGDGKVQLEYGEKCDMGGYATPLPKETVSIVKNSSFESVFGPWEISGADQLLDNTDSFDGKSSLRINSGTSVEINLEQPNFLFANKSYDVYLKLKKLGTSGAINDIKFQVGDKSSPIVWSNAASFLLAGEAAEWRFYELKNYLPQNYSYRVRLNFSVAANTIFLLDDIALVPFDPTIRPQYQCGNDPITGEICQFKGGYCGDGLPQDGRNGQPNFGETCDDRVGLDCSGGKGCGVNGTCINAATGSACAGGDKNCICKSEKCNDICQSTYCGDGIVQRPNSSGQNEVCDWRSDPLCNHTCGLIKMGGLCTNDQSNPCPAGNISCRQCEANLSCTIRNFGDTDKTCLGARGSKGCRSNKDCILGYYCNVSTSKCESEVSTYLRYHPEEETVLTLPNPSDAPYDINNSRCPEIVKIPGDKGQEYKLDICTGLNWSSYDSFSRSSWSYTDAIENACEGAFRLPTILELYSLVRQTNEGLLYADEEALNLCPLKCEYDENDFTDFCNDPCGDDNYLYWSSSCSARLCVGGINAGKICEIAADCPGVGASCSGKCVKALAVNFKYGSIEELPVVNLDGTAYNEEVQAKARCLKDTVCGNNMLEEGESCEFLVGSGGIKIEQEITEDDCTDFNYDGGFLHCNPSTCTYTFNNCYLNSNPGKSCADICTYKMAKACHSVGLDVSKAEETYISSSQTYSLAANNKMMDYDPNGDCEAVDIPNATACNYSFVPKGAACRLDGGALSPFNAQYSYCNCEEE